MSRPLSSRLAFERWRSSDRCCNFEVRVMYGCLILIGGISYRCRACLSIFDTTNDYEFHVRTEPIFDLLSYAQVNNHNEFFRLIESDPLLRILLPKNNPFLFGKIRYILSISIVRARTTSNRLGHAFFSKFQTIVGFVAIQRERERERGERFPFVFPIVVATVCCEGSIARGAAFPRPRGFH